MKAIMLISVLAMTAIPTISSADYCPPASSSFLSTVVDRVSYDKRNRLYTYSYSIQNDRSSTVPIILFDLRMKVSPTELRSPKHWIGKFKAESPETGDESHARWFTYYSATAQDPNDDHLPIPDEAIRSGRSLNGFSFQSPSPPGIVQYYLDGYRDIPVASANPENPDPELNCPDLDLETPKDLRRVNGMTTGPADPNVKYVRLRLRDESGHKRCGPFHPGHDEGKIKLLVLSSKDFDASQIDVNSITFGPDDAKPLDSALVIHDKIPRWADEDEAWEKAYRSFKGDMENSKRKNLLLTFDKQALGVTCVLDQALFLHAKTTDGKSVLGGVSAKTIGCDVKHPGRRKHLPKPHESARSQSHRHR